MAPKYTQKYLIFKSNFSTSVCSNSRFKKGNACYWTFEAVYMQNWKLNFLIFLEPTITTNDQLCFKCSYQNILGGFLFRQGT